MEGGMLSLLLLLHKAATARTTSSDYGYIEAYSGDQENQLQHGSDYMDNKTDDNHESVDSEVNNKSPFYEDDFGSNDDYIEAYSGDQVNQLENGSDYMDYDDDYEYKNENDFRSGGVDPEVKQNI